MSNNFLNDSKAFEDTPEYFETESKHEDVHIKLEDSGPFLPSFLFSDDESILDVSNTAINSSDPTSLLESSGGDDSVYVPQSESSGGDDSVDVPQSESSGGDDSVYVPQLRKCDSKGYEADEDGDFSKHGSIPLSLDIKDKGDVVIIYEDKVNDTDNLKDQEHDDSILDATEASGISIDCSAALTKDDLNADITYDYEDSELMEEIIYDGCKALVDRKEEVKALKDELEEAIGAKGMALIKMMDDALAVEGTTLRVEEDQAVRLEDVSKETTAAKDVEVKEKELLEEDCQYLSESFGFEKEQEVAVHDENEDESDIEMIFASPTNQALLQDTVIGDEDTRFNHFLNHLGGGLFLYFLFMFITLIIYQILNLYVSEDDVAHDDFFEDFPVDIVDDNRD